MKRCPECRRDYYDETLLYCLDDGTPLLEGPATEASATVMLPASEEPSEAQTRTVPATDEPANKQTRQEASPIRKPFTKWAAIVLAVLVSFVVVGFAVFRSLSNRAPAISLDKATVTRLTTTGKASAAAISPDGRYVVHVQNDGGQNSLWMRQIATQSNVQIVPPIPNAIYTSIAFSPDGDYVYYTLRSPEIPQRALFQVPTLGGPTKKILDNLSPDSISFAPDGKQFAFVRTSPGRESVLMAANLDGTGERGLFTVKSPSETIRCVVWSADGKKIAYADLNSETNVTSIAELQTSDGSTRPITSQTWLRVNGLAWLPDSSGLLMLATAGQSFSNQVWLVTYPSGEARRLTNDLNNYQSMSLSADANTLSLVKSEQQASIWTAPIDDLTRVRAVTSGTGKTDVVTDWANDGRLFYHSNAGGIDDIWVVGADGSDPKQLTANSRINQGPVVSPDGQYIVFLSDRTGVPHLWRMKTDGSDQRQLTDGVAGEQNARFSPDGKWLIYRTTAGRSTIWKKPVDGGDAVQLTDHGSALSPAISPDGRSFAYGYREDNNAPWQIAVASIDGGPALKTYGVQNVSAGAPVIRWTTDGQALAYIGSQNGVSNIVEQPLDGGPLKQITDFKSDLLFSFAFSRDGKQIAFSRGTISSDVVLFKDIR